MKSKTANLNSIAFDQINLTNMSEEEMSITDGGVFLEFAIGLAIGLAIAAWLCG